jgi:putative flavoprotein involved in K+ transport
MVSDTSRQNNSIPDKQHRGVTRFPGLYFLGMNLLYNRKSGILLGVGEDAAHLAAHIAAIT